MPVAASTDVLRREAPTVERDVQGRVGTFICGLGCHHPERRVTNADLVERMDTTDEWIVDHTGIRERRYAPDDVNTSDLGVLATRNALEDAGVEPTELALLVCATSTPDGLIPSTASYIANKLGLPSAAFDVGASCSGFIYGLAVARGLMHAHDHPNVAICTAEKYTRVTDPADRANSIFWGDAAAAAILQPRCPKVGLEVVDVSLSAHNHGADLVRIPIGGHFEMQGRAVKRIAFQGMVDSAMDMLARHDLEPGDLRAFISHQASLRMVEALRDHMGVAEERCWHNVELFGNQGAAGVLCSFIAGLREHGPALVDGDLFLLTVYGAGFTSGSALLRWVAQ